MKKKKKNHLDVLSDAKSKIEATTHRSADRRSATSKEKQGHIIEWRSYDKIQCIRGLKSANIYMRMVKEGWFPNAYVWS